MSNEVILEVLKKKIDDTSSFKLFFNENIQTKQKVMDYVKGYNFFDIIDKSGMPRDDEEAIEKSNNFGCFLIFAANKHGAEFVLTSLLSQNVIHKKYSKLNPINWFMWIFNKIVWSEIKVCPSLETDEKFCGAIKSFQSFKLGSANNSFDGKRFSEDLDVIIQKIAEQYQQPLNTMDAPKPVDELPAAPVVANSASASPTPSMPETQATEGQPPSPPPMPGTTQTTGQQQPPPPPPPPAPGAQTAGQQQSSSADRDALLNAIKDPSKIKLKKATERVLAPEPLISPPKKNDSESKPTQSEQAKSIGDIMKEAMDKRFPAIHGDDASDTNSVSGVDPDEWEDKPAQENRNVPTKSSAAVQQSPAPQPQGESAIGAQAEPTKRSKPPVPKKPKDTGASNRDSGISSRSESDDKPSPGSLKDQLSRLAATGSGMFAGAASVPVKTSVSQLSQSATPTMSR